MARSADQSPDATEDAYPGQRLGLPASGTGALATWRTRFTGLVLDWLLAMVLAGVFFGRAALVGDGWQQFMVPVLFFVHTAAMITFAGASTPDLAKCVLDVARAGLSERGVLEPGTKV